jgi:hypothetical protein
MSDQQIQIKLFDTVPIIPLKVMPAGTHTFRINTGGNSFLSTIYCKSATAPVEVKYYDLGAGDDGMTGARIDLGAHDPVSTGQSHRTVITRIHNNLRVDVIITGGDAEIGLIGTVVSDFPAKIDTSGSDVNTNVVTTAHIANFTMALAATEYPFTFPAKIRRFTIKNRGGSLIQFSYVAGQSGSVYFSIEPGTTYDEMDLKVDSLTIYLQSPSPGQVLEIISWS